MKKLLAAMAMAVCAQAASAAVVYDTWSTNEGISGNYILTVTQDADRLDFNLTVNPWNAEALGLFVDLGNVNVGALTLSSVLPAGQVSVFATDTTSDDCGQGCNLNGLPVGSGYDGEWEMVFRLGDQGYDGIQTFSFTVDSNLLDLTEAMLGTVGIRAQQLCPAGTTLPGGISNCGGSDKSWGVPNDPNTPPPLPEPAMLGLLGLGLAGIAAARRRRAA